MRPDGDIPVYVISVAARLCGLPAWMLRLLDQEGVVIPSRTEKGRRLYSDNDIVRLERVRFLTEEKGVNMAGVKLILDMDERSGDDAFRQSGSQETPFRTPERPIAERLNA